ncbi:hypothetical protein Sste5346_008285 [Sporothrix stenoceras]|uniref:Inositolphosphotransferase Aur1/Ipt1 domain-containing protein n=1 Tax=Sporothrix stenoceras TaxID=5173 RepID=A0ABR3YRC6_9PEZI
MVLGPFVEVGVILGLLSGGTLINRDTHARFFLSPNNCDDDSNRLSSPNNRSPAPRNRSTYGYNDDTEAGRTDDEGIVMAGPESWQLHKFRLPSTSSASSASSSTTALNESPLDPNKHYRTLRLWRWQYTVASPNTEIFKDRLLSRVLRKFPFLVEAWYWALIYWVYQLGRAFSALVIIDESVVEAARRHALQLVHLEKSLHLFVEVPIQQYFMQSSTLMHWINRIYSFIHIPGTILFLIVLYYLTTTRPQRLMQNALSSGVSPTRWRNVLDSYHPDLYEKRRRTMAMCNLLAFIIFTAWPCMPPRLLSDPNLASGLEAEGLDFGFVDTVHSATGESSVWTTNKFCNQYAAMPSLHFGYSFLIGLTIATMPLSSDNNHNRSGRPSLKRILVVIGALIYPATILVAIIATANHFVLDAVAGAIICGLAWKINGVLLNLLPLEDYFLWAVRIHKPSKVPTTHSYPKLRSAV